MFRQYFTLTNLKYFTKYSRKTRKNLTLEQARAFAQKVKHDIPSVQYVEHRAVCGYPSADSKYVRTNLDAILETYKGYIFAFIGTDHVLFEGYKACV